MIVLRPHTVEDALAMKHEHPTAVPVAGGTDVYVNWPEHLEARDRSYIDLSRLRSLQYVRFADDELVIGAGATYWDVLRDAQCAREFPMLLDAAKQVGAVQIQSRGTWAGNIANASPAADGVPVLMAYDAEVVLASTRGERRVSLDSYYIDYKVTVAEPDELITAIHLPGRAYSFNRFEKIGARRAQAITKVGVAVAKSNAGWRVAANSMAPMVKRCRQLERQLDGGAAFDAPAAVASVLDMDLNPIDDVRSSATYRRNVLARVLYAMMEEVRAIQ